MTERPILFSGAMVRAILEGRKTQTRRVVKPPRERFDTFLGTHHDGEEGFLVGVRGAPDYVNVACPYGVPGDRLWVRETWAAPHGCDHLKPSEILPWTSIHYRATEDAGGLLWRPSIFMPRWACRLVLEVTAVRVERLQRIGAADAIAEGIRSDRAHAVADYALLWDSLNAKRAPWASNPLVWVVEFRKP